jgi:hypothetical protein
MKNSEIGMCELCGGKLVSGPGGPAAGARITFQRLVVNQAKMMEYMGLGMILGGSAKLADAFSTGDVIEEPEGLRESFIACEKCIEPILGMMESLESET